MFEKEIKFIVDFNLNKIRKLGSFFTFEKLERAGVHPSILKYISSEIDFLIYEDRKKLLQNSAFDYSGSEILNYFNLISDEIKKTKRLNFEDVKKLLIQAVSFTANYLIRPKWSLSKLIFESSPNTATKSAEEIRYFLRFTYYYEYINTIFSAVINKKQITSLTKEEFEEIFEKFDKELFITQPQKMIDNALYSMADFFNIGAVAKTKITVAHVESFLKGKNLNDYIFRLKQSLPHDAKSKYEIDSIRTALYFPSHQQPIQEEVESFDEEIKHEDESITVENEELNINLAEVEEEVVNEPEPTLPIKEIVALQSVIAEIENEKTDFNRENSEEQIEEVPEKEEDKVEITDNKILEKETVAEENQEEIKDAELLLTELERELLEDIDEALFSSEKNYSSNENEKPVKSLAEEEKLFDEINNLKQQTDEALAEIENDSGNENKNLEDLILEEENPENEIFVESKSGEVDENEIAEEQNETTKIEYETDLDEQNEDEIKIETVELTVEDIFNEKPEVKNEDLIENEEDSELEYVNEEIKEAENEIDDLLEDENEVFEDDEDVEEIIEEVNTKQETVQPKVNIKRDKDIFDYISDKEAARITSVVFQDDSEDFATTLEKISECSNYEEATEILKAVYNSYKVNYYSREAILLTNIVGNFFGQDH